MVPPIKYYLIGGYLREDSTKKDIDIVGVMGERDFDLAFGLNHQELMDAYKEIIRGQKLERYIQANKIAGWVLSQFFGKRVDFKWCLPSMLYAPYMSLDITLDVNEYIDKRNIHLQR